MGFSLAVTDIGRYAFYKCTSLKSVTFDENSKLTSLGSYPFYECSSLKNINFGGTVEQWKAISKSYGWDYDTGDYTIYCTDGKIAKKGTVTYY